MKPRPYLTARDIERLEDAKREICTRPDIVSITVRLDNGDTRTFWLAENGWICERCDLRPKKRTRKLRGEWTVELETPIDFS